MLSRRIPRGTHDARMFIRPKEVTQKLHALGVQVEDIRGYSYYGKGAEGKHQFGFPEVRRWLISVGERRDDGRVNRM